MMTAWLLETVDMDRSNKQQLDKMVLGLKELAEQHGHDILSSCEKCYADYGSVMPVAYKPYGGATTFSEIDQAKKSGNYQSAIAGLNEQLRAVLENISSDTEMTAAQKSAAISQAAEEFKSRADQITPENANDFWYKEKAGKRMSNSRMNMLKAAFDTIKSLVSWGSYDDGEERDDDEENKTEEKELAFNFKEASGFKVIQTAAGPRWLSFSSNAFEDSDKELFTTAALEEAVKHADDNEERGPLRIFHVKGADIGDADFQAVHGRFLLESGTFRDDDLGKAGLKYFQEHTDDKFQVSIGFEYKVGDEKDGVYDWLRIKERSVTPFGRAANPYTSFAYGETSQEGEEMDESKSKMLTDIFGEKLASQIIQKAETDTKELEVAGVAFKAKQEQEAAAAAEAATSPETPKAAEIGQPQIDALGTMIADLIEGQDKAEKAIVTLSSAVVELQNELRSDREAAKAAAEAAKENTPRGVSAFSRSSSQGTELDPEKFKNLVGEEGKEQPPFNPIAPYLADLGVTV